MQTYEYKRDVYYHETDKMGAVHHSNYLRWLDEARYYFFRDTGFGDYALADKAGIIAPILDVNLNFRNFALFGDHIIIRMRVIKYTGIRYWMEYSGINQDGVILFDGISGHAFIDTDFKPIVLSRSYPELNKKMEELVSQPSEEISW